MCRPKYASALSCSTTTKVFLMVERSIFCAGVAFAALKSLSSTHFCCCSFIIVAKNIQSRSQFWLQLIFDPTVSDDSQCLLLPAGAPRANIRAQIAVIFSSSHFDARTTRCLWTLDGAWQSPTPWHHSLWFTIKCLLDKQVLTSWTLIHFDCMPSHCQLPPSQSLYNTNPKYSQPSSSNIQTLYDNLQRHGIKVRPFN